MHQCATCSRQWSDADAVDNEYQCTRRCGGLLTPSSNAEFEDTLTQIDLSRLPSMIAIPLQDLENETHPVVQLWHVCDTVEMLLRFCVAIGAGVLDGSLSDTVARVLVDRIERPTLHQWFEMARAIAFEEIIDAPVPEMRDIFDSIILPLLIGEPSQTHADPASSVIALRNSLAHGAGFGRRAAENILPGHIRRLHEAIVALPWLEDVVPFVCDEDGQVRVLRGADPSQWLQPTVPTPLQAYLGTSAPGNVSIFRNDRIFSVFPIHAFTRSEPPRARGSGSSLPPRSWPMVYSRRVGRRLEMTTLGCSLPTAELRNDAVSQFELLFRLRDRDALRGAMPSDFRDEFTEESRSLVGRHQIVAAVLRQVRASNNEVLWLHGAPGMGKSAVLSRIAIELDADEGRGRRLVAWRFRAGDVRATRQRFLRYAIDRLESWKSLGVGRSALGDDPDVLEERLAHLLKQVTEPASVVFVLDGLDEIARVDPGFVNLPLRLLGAVWLCAGRPDPVPLSAFAPGRCKWVFSPDGLPPLEPKSVAEWLKRDAPPALRDMIVREERNGCVSQWVSEVSARSGGLAAYIRLVVDDLQTHELVVGQLPPDGLEAYFERLLDRAGADDPAALLPATLATIALSVEAPDIESLEEVLHRAGALQSTNREAHAGIVAEAITRARSMLRVVVVDGVERFLPYHDEFARHLSSTPRLNNARAVARRGLCLLARGASDTQSSQVLEFAFSTGIRQLISFDASDVAREVFFDFDYLMRRLDTADTNSMGQILRDLDAVANVSPLCDAELEWSAFLSRFATVLARSGPTALLQTATSLSDGSVVAEAVARWLSSRRHTLPWLRQIHRPSARRMDWCEFELPRQRTFLGFGLEGSVCLTDTTNTVSVWDAMTGAKLRDIPIPPGAEHALDPQGRSLAVSGDAGVVSIWNLRTGESRQVGSSGPERSHGRFIWFPDGSRILTIFSKPQAARSRAHSDEAIGRTIDAVVHSVCDADDSERVSLNISTVQCISIRDDGLEVAFSENHDIEIWNIQSGTIEHRNWNMRAHADPQLADRLGSLDAGAMFFDVRLSASRKASSRLSKMRITSDGCYLFGVSVDMSVYVLDRISSCFHRVIRCDTGQRSLAAVRVLSDDTHVIVRRNIDAPLELWNIREPSCIRKFERNLKINQIAVCENSRRLIFLDGDTLRSIELDTSTEISLRPSTTLGDITESHLSPCGRKLVCRSGSYLSVFGLASGSESIGNFAAVPGEVAAMYPHPDSEHVATLNSDGIVRVWQIPQPTWAPVGSLLRDLELGEVTRCQIDGDGTTAVSVHDADVVVWDVKRGAVVREFARGKFRRCAVSRDMHFALLFQPSHDAHAGPFSIRIIDIRNGQSSDSTLAIDGGGGIVDAGFIGDARSFVVATSRGDLYVFSRLDLRFIRRIHAPDQHIATLFSLSSLRAATSSITSAITVSLSTPKDNDPIATSDCEGADGESLRLGPIDMFALVGSEGEAVCVGGGLEFWCLNTGSLLKRATRPRGVGSGDLISGHPLRRAAAIHGERLSSVLSLDGVGDFASTTVQVLGPWEWSACGRLAFGCRFVQGTADAFGARAPRPTLVVMEDGTWKAVAHWDSESNVTAVAGSGNGIVMVGDESGRVVFLELMNWPPGAEGTG